MLFLYRSLLFHTAHDNLKSSKNIPISHEPTAKCGFKELPFVGVFKMVVSINFISMVEEGDSVVFTVEDVVVV